MQTGTKRRYCLGCNRLRRGIYRKRRCVDGVCRNAKRSFCLDGIVEIGIYALSCMPAEQVVLPASLVVIGEGAFAGCDKLKEIFIPAGVKQIGRNAFLKCVSLSSVAFEDSAAWTAVLSDDMYRKVTLDTSDRAENAENLTDVYLAYNWKKDN
ncbi:MAG: leucine-rich repeat domain-containing protein [Christensenellaceae bacterium]